MVQCVAGDQQQASLARVFHHDELDSVARDARDPGDPHLGVHVPGREAADRALQLHGGMGYSEEYHVSRYFRESRLMKIAPVSQEMILNFLGEHVLGLPRSY